MRYVTAISALFLTACASDPAWAEAWTGAVGCNVTVNDRPASIKSILEIGAQYAKNEFGPIDQRVVGISAAYGRCVNDRARLRLEAIFGAVNEDGRHARSGLIGIGYQFEVRSFLTLTPTLRVGFEDFDAGLHRTILNGSVTADAGFPLSFASEGPILTLTERPEYTDRRSGSTLTPGQRLRDGTFTNFAAGGVDFAAGYRYRAKVVLAHQYIAEHVPTNSIASVIVSARPLSDDRLSYPWNFEVWYSRGNGHFHGVLASFILRLTWGVR